MEKELGNIRAYRSFTRTDNKTKFTDRNITFILTGGRVIYNAVEQDDLIDISNKEKNFTDSISVKGENIFNAINRHNIREYEIEYIIENLKIVRSIKDVGFKDTKTESFTEKTTKLIFSKFQENDKKGRV